MKLNILKRLYNLKNNNKLLMLNNLMYNIKKEYVYNKLYVNNNINKYIKENFNKGNKLQHVNKMNEWTFKMYSYNKSYEKRLLILDKLVLNVLIKYLNYSMILDNNKIIKTIMISNPKFEHLLNKVKIKFYYYHKFNNMSNYYVNDNLIMKLLINVFNVNNNYKLSSLNLLLTKLYNKLIEFEPIRLSNNYNNSTILNKVINKEINFTEKIIKYKFIDKLNNSMPKYNSKIIAMIYNIMLLDMNELKINNLFNYINNNNNNNNKNDILLYIYNNLNINNVPNNLLLYKYLTGWIIQYKGKPIDGGKTVRKTKKLFFNGTCQNNIISSFGNNKSPSSAKGGFGNINNTLKLNYISANNDISNISNINKNGKYNINIKLNYT